MSDPVPEPAVTVCAVRETAPGEQRVALVPESVPVLARAQVRVLVESGAGAAACFPDGSYERAGAQVVSRNEAIDRADILVGVGMPGPDLTARLRAGQTVIGMLRPLVQPDLVCQLAEAGVTAQPGRAAAHGEPGPIHGRAHLPGQRGRLQGRAGRRR